jgi:hypothetical protein
MEKSFYRFALTQARILPARTSEAGLSYVVNSRISHIGIS